MDDINAILDTFTKDSEKSKEDLRIVNEIQERLKERGVLLEYKVIIPNETIQSS